MTDFNWIFLGGKLVQSVTSVTLANNTLLNVDTVVPTGKRWLLLNIRTLNPDNVTRTIYAVIWKEAAATNRIKMIHYDAVSATAATNWPSMGPTDALNFREPVNINATVILEAGNLLRVTWAAGGASAGGTDADGLVIEYLEVDA